MKRVPHPSPPLARVGTTAAGGAELQRCISLHPPVIPNAVIEFPREFDHGVESLP